MKAVIFARVSSKDQEEVIHWMHKFSAAMNMP